MRERTVAVLGGGATGLTAALLLARDGHRVVLVERDGLEAGAPEAAVGWDRPGIPHFLQPHAFTPRGRSELRRHLPDVLDALLSHGADEVDLRRKMPGHATGPDEELQYVAARRPLIEWALRRAVLAEPRVVVRAGARAEGLRIEGGRVTGVRVDGAVVDSDVVVDALGRRTPTPSWLAGPDLRCAETETSDCGVVYYSRYYRVRDGLDLPDGPWFLSPRGDLGYLGYSTFPGDNRTFAALLAVPTGVPEWRGFREAATFEAATARIPPLASWTDPDLVVPITGVLPMAGLRNTFRSVDGLAGSGVFPVGDALTHTDPVMAAGLAFGIGEAAALAVALRTDDDLADVHERYVASIAAELRERYDLATDLDQQRLRMWRGEPVDPTSPEGDYQLFVIAGGGAASTRDGDVARPFLRRIGLLDRPHVLDDDHDLLRRIQSIFAAMRAEPRPPAGPMRDEMVELATAPSPA